MVTGRPTRWKRRVAQTPSSVCMRPRRVHVAGAPAGRGLLRARGSRLLFTFQLAVHQRISAILMTTRDQVASVRRERQPRLLFLLLVVASFRLETSATAGAKQSGRGYLAMARISPALAGAVLHICRRFWIEAGDPAADPPTCGPLCATPARSAPAARATPTRPGSAWRSGSTRSREGWRGWPGPRCDATTRPTRSARPGPRASSGRSRAPEQGGPPRQRRSARTDTERGVRPALQE
jgi:hypothetical protein